jgi:hypothetical protein
MLFGQSRILRMCSGWEGVWWGRQGVEVLLASARNRKFALFRFR